MFDEHKANETIFMRKLKVYWETYPKFKYDSPSKTLKDNLNTNFN